MSGAMSLSDLLAKCEWEGGIIETCVSYGALELDPAGLSEDTVQCWNDILTVSQELEALVTTFEGLPDVLAVEMEEEVE